MKTRVVIFTIFLISSYLHACPISFNSGTYDEAAILSAMSGCDQMIIPDDATVEMNGDWDLTSLGAITITIQGNGSLVLGGNGNKVEDITLAEGSSMIIEDTSNTNALTGGTSNNSPRIIVGTTEYYASDYNDIINNGGFGPALPVALSHIAIQKIRNNFYLQWSTNFEYNNKTFIIQGSLEGRLWDDIDEFEGKGNTNLKSNYEYLITQDVLFKYRYIRLVQEDFDTKKKSYNPIKLPNIDIPMSVYPNPTTSVIHFKNIEKNTLGMIIDQKGKIVMEFNTPKCQCLNVAFLDKGLYYLKFNNTQFDKKMMFIKL